MSDGSPYGPYRYRALLKEKYIISKNSNISYGEIDNLTPAERQEVLNFIAEELQKTRDLMEQQQKR